MLDLLDAVLLPKEVSVIHCRGHQKREDKIAEGNKVAGGSYPFRAAIKKYTPGSVLWESILLPPETTI
jgi:hypothetical protein